MTDVLHHPRDPQQKLGGSVGNLADNISRGSSGNSTPNKNYGFNLSISHEGSPANRGSRMNAKNSMVSLWNLSFIIIIS